MCKIYGYFRGIENTYNLLNFLKTLAKAKRKIEPALHNKDQRLCAEIVANEIEGSGGPVGRKSVDII